MTGERSDLNISKKVLKYETFLNDVLKEQLKATHNKLDYLTTEIAEYMQIKLFIETVQNANLERDGLKTQVDIGCSFFIEAKSVDATRITINAGCGIWLDLSLKEAMFLIDKRIKFLESQTDQEIAPANLRCTDFMSKYRFVHQAISGVTIARIRDEPPDKRSTHRQRSKLTSLTDYSIDSSSGNTPKRTACGELDALPMKKRRLSANKCHDNQAEADTSVHAPNLQRRPDQRCEPKNLDLGALGAHCGTDGCISSSIGGHNKNERLRLDCSEQCKPIVPTLWSSVTLSTLKLGLSKKLERAVGDKTAANCLAESAKLKETNETLSANTKNIDFRTLAKNFPVRVESGISTEAQDNSAGGFANARTSRPKIPRMRKKIKEECSSLSSTHPVAQWTGGVMTVLSRPEFDNVEGTTLVQCVGNAGFTTEKIGSSGIIDIEAFSHAKGVVSVAEAVNNKRKSDTAGICDEHFWNGPPDASECADATPPSPQSMVQCSNKAASSADKSFTIEALLKFNNKNDLIEKVVEADAKLIEDVGNDAEKVVAYRCLPDLDIPFDKTSYINGGMFKCPFCPLHFSCYSDIERHCVEWHSEGWSYMESAFLRSLVPYRPEGFRETHPQLKFKCIFCSMLFPSHDGLCGHLAERHYGNTPYECPFCAKRFKNSHSYSIHLDKHILDSNYPSHECNACTACFSSPWELNLHSEIHDRLSPIIVD